VNDPKFYLLQPLDLLLVFLQFFQLLLLLKDADLLDVL
jgi:hypothetical protein